jgi:hypothetical protein
MEISRDLPTRDAAGESNEKDVEDNVGLEQHATRNSLNRQLSGPPYSVFSSGTKMWIVFLVSISALISPFGATTFYPALNVLSDKLHVTPAMINISITTYMVGAERHHTCAD